DCFAASCIRHKVLLCKYFFWRKASGQILARCACAPPAREVHSRRQACTRPDTKQLNPSSWFFADFPKCGQESCGFLSCARATVPAKKRLCCPTERAGKRAKNKAGRVIAIVDSTCRIAIHNQNPICPATFEMGNEAQCAVPGATLE